MNTGIKTHNNGHIESSFRYNNESFNFELWAKEVRPQLVAALQKRSTKK